MNTNYLTLVELPHLGSYVCFAWALPIENCFLLHYVMETHSSYSVGGMHESGLECVWFHTA